MYTIVSNKIFCHYNSFSEIEDYISVNALLEYSKGETTQSFEIKMINDNEPEPTEQFKVTITSRMNVIVLTPVIICDEDDGNDKGTMHCIRASILEGNTSYMFYQLTMLPYMQIMIRAVQKSSQVSALQ